MNLFFLKILTWLLNGITFKVRKPQKVIFIVGVPRCGSTFLYQLLSNTNQYSYANNFVDYHSKRFFTGASLTSFLFLQRRPHNNFKSKFGDTKDFGLNAPSEAGVYWRNIRQFEQWTRAKREINVVTSFSARKYLVKNLFNSLYISELITNFDNPIFIHLTRNKESNCKSILKARKKHSVNKFEKWSVFPDGDIKFNSEQMLVDYQYESINKHISSELINYQNVFRVTYEDLLNDEQKVLRNIIALCQ